MDTRIIIDGKFFAALPYDMVEDWLNYQRKTQKEILSIRTWTREEITLKTIGYRID